jgi:hypothetical protein
MNMSYVLIVFESMTQQNLGGKKNAIPYVGIFNGLGTNTLDEAIEALRICLL